MGVKEGEPVAKWNRAHPDKCLRPGCKILTINGIATRSLEDVTGELASGLQLRFVVVPPEEH
eukprot:NODE_8465_length_382_cov_162.908257.p3 GENE.NODE_8465_length_382_cov_162.908257~~NODE_8465_length_382_cov_162.908257.p3  ORF type:complete len:62 (+),score=14.63 NODE_8465_length_382_cov_162.908257:3-188(+)